VVRNRTALENSLAVSSVGVRCFWRVIIDLELQRVLTVAYRHLHPMHLRSAWEENKLSKALRKSFIQPQLKAEQVSEL